MDKPIFRTVHGSRLYGLSNALSDWDMYAVYEGDGRTLRHIVEGEDLVVGTLPAFVTRAMTGSHQSVEALFSREKDWAPGMEEKWGPYLAGMRIGGAEVFEKYERTITALCYGDFKRRRHAVRLALNLEELRKYGRFNPRLTPHQIRAVNFLADFEGDNLRWVLTDA